MSLITYQTQKKTQEKHKKNTRKRKEEKLQNSTSYSFQQIFIGNSIKINYFMRFSLIFFSHFIQSEFSQFRGVLKYNKEMFHHVLNIKKDKLKRFSYCNLSILNFFFISTCFFMIFL